MGLEQVEVSSFPVNSYVVFYWFVLLVSVTYTSYVTLNLKQMQHLFYGGN